jgi:hypothetical protein
MPDALVTVVVVPRESFSATRASLESIVTRTSAPYELVYVDARSPRPVARYLERRTRELGFTLVRTERYLSPNEARNLGFGHVRTPYTVFVDNNAVVADGWLDALVECAAATGASFVAPTYCIGPLDQGKVHMAGGEGRIAVSNGSRGLVDVHYHGGRRLAELGGELRRVPCEIAEFHCVLVRSEVYERVGGCDEQLPAALEHIDFCLQATAHAGGGWYEPASVVTYLPPPPFASSDLPYYLLRWSRAWIEASFAHFAAKWDLSLGDDPGLQQNRAWLEHYRWSYLRRLRARVRHRLGPRADGALEKVADGLVDRTVVRAASRARRPGR